MPCPHQVQSKSVSAQVAVETMAKVHGVKAIDYAKFSQTYRRRAGHGDLCVSSGRATAWTTRRAKVEHLLNLNTQHKA